MNGFFGTSPWTNVFWLRNGGGVTPSEADFIQVVNLLLSKYMATLLSLQHTSSQTTAATGLYYGADRILYGVEVANTGFGQHAATAEPASVAACIGWRVNQHYRGGHPRTYIGGMSSQAIANPRGLDPAWVSTAVTNANNFHSQVNAISVGNFIDTHLGVVSFVLRDAWRSPTIFRDFIPGAAHCDQRIDTQRRRLGPDPVP